MSQQRDRKQDKSETEHLKGIIRELQKEVRSLTKRLKHSLKREHLYEQLEPEPAPEPIEIKRRKSCDKCFVGFYDEYEILDKVIVTCDNDSCGDRKRLK